MCYIAYTYSSSLDSSSFKAEGEVEDRAAADDDTFGVPVESWFMFCMSVFLSMTMRSSVGSRPNRSCNNVR